MILKRVTRSRDRGLNEWTRSKDLKRRPTEYQDLSLKQQEKEGEMDKCTNARMVYKETRTTGGSVMAFADLGIVSEAPL